VDAGANTFQFFSSSPRTWKTSPVKPEEAVKMREARAKHDVNPIVIHASYLINLCSQVESVRANSVSAFRGEVERALAWGAEYLVLHPGSWNGLTREEGLRLAVEGIERATEGLPWHDHNFKVLIENTAGAEFSLGATLEQVAELVERCCDVAHALTTRIGALEGAEILWVPQINQGLVRFVDPRDGSPAACDAFTERVMAKILASGVAFFTGTTWRGQRAMRISVCNWQTSMKDVDRVVVAVDGILRRLRA